MQRGSDRGATAGSSTTSTQWHDAVESVAAYVSESLPPVDLEHATSAPAGAQLAVVKKLLDNVNDKLDRLLTVTGRTLALEEQADVLAPDLFDRVADLDHRLVELFLQEQENRREIKEVDNKLERLFAFEANDHHQVKATLGVIVNGQISKILGEAVLRLRDFVFDGVAIYKVLFGMALMCCLHLLLGLKGEREHTQDWAGGASWSKLQYSQAQVRDFHV